MSSLSYRTHTAGELRAADVGRKVVLLGWVHRVRNLGGLVFIDVRDRYGITQVVVRTGSPAADAADRVRPEFVVSIQGTVDSRSAESVNPKIATGRIEVVADDVEILNEAKTPPFPINDDSPVAEETRLRYRYLDLRRPALQQNLVLRHRVALAARAYFDSQQFLEIETPILTRSDARRRARLPGAQPRASGRVLCAAAVAANLQADPDDCRHGPVLSDRPVLPRRGPAR
jgi:aspartyl-tRNA synthetase